MSEQPDQDLDLGGGEAAPDPADDPLAGVPPEPIQDMSEASEEERLGGDGAAIGDPPAEEVLQEPEEREEPEEPGNMGAPQAENPPAGEAVQETQEPAPTEPAPKKEGKKKTKGPKTPSREYKVLRIEEDESIASPLEHPVKARNGDDAIKEAYKALSDTGEESMTLVAIPVGYFKLKKVKGREKKDYAVEID